jgi:hypothetical protein
MAAQTKANSGPITLEQIQEIFGGTLGAPSQYADAEPDRVITTIELGQASHAIQIALDPQSPGGIRVLAPLKVLTACDEHVRDLLNVPRQPRAKADNDNIATDETPAERGQRLMGLPPAKPLQIIDPTSWEGVPVKHREWFVPGLIPSRTVTLLSGDGGTGKSQLALQLVAASALRTEWLGLPVADGPCLFYTAEDEADELHKRLACIVEHAGRRLADLTGIRLIPMVDRDPVLGMPAFPTGQIKPTPVFELLMEECAALMPKLVVLDTSADVFGGDEIKRVQVRQFIGHLKQLAVTIDCAVLLLSHPSLTGMASGTGSSGSTAWNNSVRSRLYLTAEGERESNSRILRVQKTNYGPPGGEIALHWHNGVFVLDGGPDTVAEGFVNAQIDGVYLALLVKLTGQGQDLSPNRSSIYAPTVMARHTDAKGYNKKKLEAAQQRLLDAKRIHVVTEGSPSRQRKRIVAGPPL